MHDSPFQKRLEFDDLPPVSATPIPRAQSAQEREGTQRASRRSRPGMSPTGPAARPGVLPPPGMPTGAAWARTSDPDTSQAAALEEWRFDGWDTLRGRLARVYRHFYPRSLTAEEAAEIAGIPVTHGPWKRVSELVKANVLVVTTERAVNASSGAKARLLQFNPEALTSWQQWTAENANETDPFPYPPE